MYRGILRLSCLLLLLALPRAAASHELWFDTAGDGLVLMRGHLAAEDAHGEPAAPCPAHELRRAVILDAAGAPARLSAPDTFPTAWPADAAAVAVELSSGCWTKTPRGTVNLPRDQVVSPLESWLSLESIKRIAAWTPRLAEPLDGREGAGLEITPCADPLALERGDKLTVRVTYDGRPVAGAIVLYAGRPRGTTGVEGRTNIRLREAGRQQITASFTSEQSCTEYDRIIATAVLEFELEQK